jgi:small acid-soluble spore protein (thioredoxin-like protein)
MHRILRFRSIYIGSNNSIGGIPLAKPDNRADNEEHLQEHIDQTQANIQEAENYLDEHADELSVNERQTIEDKNHRRKESIKGFIDEKKDEAEQ